MNSMAYELIEPLIHVELGDPNAHAIVVERIEARGLAALDETRRRETAIHLLTLEE